MVRLKISTIMTTTSSFMKWDIGLCAIWVVVLPGMESIIRGELQVIPEQPISKDGRHYFSAIMRDEPTVYDYDSTGHYFGGNLKTGYVKASSSSSHTEKIEKQTPYSKNMEYEANVGSALWNLSDKYSTYREMERVMKNPRANWQEFYDAYMNNITANEEGAWNICENFNIAFDLEVPQVTLFISDNIASMTASDNVAVKSYEWYVDGSLVFKWKWGFKFYCIKCTGANSGTHTVECRVYDAEGLASGDRPRQERYGSASKVLPNCGRK